MSERNPHANKKQEAYSVKIENSRNLLKTDELLSRVTKSGLRREIVHNSTQIPIEADSSKLKVNSKITFQVHSP
jgi:hypothetical protein